MFINKTSKFLQQLNILALNNMQYIHFKVLYITTQYWISFNSIFKAELSTLSQHVTSIIYRISDNWLRVLIVSLLQRYIFLCSISFVLYHNLKKSVSFNFMQKVKMSKKKGWAPWYHASAERGWKSLLALYNLRPKQFSENSKASSFQLSRL